MARQSSRGTSAEVFRELVVRRLASNREKFDLDVVADFVDKTKVTMSTWLRGKNQPSTITAIKLWHLMELAGISSPELKKVRAANPYSEAVGCLLAFGVISLDDACHIAGGVKIEAVYRAVRGESQGFENPTYKLAELNELYGAKLEEARRQLSEKLGVEPPAQRTRTRTRGGQPVEPVKPMPRRLPRGVTPATFAGPNSRIVTIDDSELKMPEEAASTEQDEAASANVPEDRSTDAPASEELPPTEPEEQQSAASSDPNESTKEDDIESPTAEAVLEQFDVATDPAASWGASDSVAKPADLTDVVESSSSEGESDSTAQDLATPVEQQPAETHVSSPADVPDIEELADSLIDHLGLGDKQSLTAFLVSRRGGGYEVPIDRLLASDRQEKLHVMAKAIKQFEVDLAYLLQTLTDEEYTFLRKLVGEQTFHNIKILATKLTGWRAKKQLEEGTHA